MQLLLPTFSHLQRLRHSGASTVVLMNARHEAVGYAYKRCQRLYPEPFSLTESLLDPPPGSWTGRLSRSERFDLVRERFLCGRLSAVDYQILLGDRGLGCLPIQ